MYIYIYMCVYLHIHIYLYLHMHHSSRGVDVEWRTSQNKFKNIGHVCSGRFASELFDILTFRFQN